MKLKISKEHIKELSIKCNIKSQLYLSVYTENPINLFALSMKRCQVCGYITVMTCVHSSKTSLQQYFHIVLFIWRVVLTFRTVDKILMVCPLKLILSDGNIFFSFSRGISKFINLYSSHYELEQADLGILQMQSTTHQLWESFWMGLLMKGGLRGDRKKILGEGSDVISYLVELLWYGKITKLRK